MAKSVNDFIVDFGQEQSGGGGGVRVKPGTYRVKIIAAKTGTSEQKNTPYLELKLKFLEGQPAKQKKVLTEHLYIRPKALSRFRKLLEALDINQPTKLNLVKLIPKIKGGELYVKVDDEPPREGYDTPRSRVTFEGFINPDDYDPDDEDEEDEEDEDLEEEDEDEEEDEEEEEEPPKRKRSSSKAKSTSRSRKRKAAEEEDDEDEDEEDEDEEPAPKKKRSTSKAKKSKKAADDEDEEDDDLDSLDLDQM